MKPQNAYLAKQQAKRRAEIKANREDAAAQFAWLSIVALNDEFGFGGARAERYAIRLGKVADEFLRMKNDDYIYAVEKLRQRVEQILRTDTKKETSNAKLSTEKE